MYKLKLNCFFLNARELRWHSVNLAQLSTNAKKVHQKEPSILQCNYNKLLRYTERLC